jgi:Na+/proline symporter
MSLERQRREQIDRLRKMGWTFLGLAAFISGVVYFLPRNETIYWLSANGKEGFYVLSAFFVFLGLYCLGAIWRRRNFI